MGAASAAPAHWHLDRYEQSRTCAGRALTIARQAGFRVHEGQALTCLAAVHLDRDEPEQTIGHAERALAIHRETGHRLGEAHTLVTLGHAALQANDSDAATTHWQQARTLFTTLRVAAAQPDR